MASKKLTAAASAQNIGGDLGIHELSVSAKGIGKNEIIYKNSLMQLP
jgi:hypothetical protein